MAQPDDLKVFKADARKLIRHARTALAEDARTPEEEHGRSQKVDTIWEQFTGRLIEVIESAYATVPEGVMNGSQRTQIIEQAIKEITESIIQYPSTPYTASNAQTLGEMLKSLEISKKIDRDDEEPS